MFSSPKFASIAVENSCDVRRKGFREK